MSFKESSRNPLVDFFSDIEDQSWDSTITLFFGLIDGFLEETNESFKGILIHMTHNTKSDDQEI